MNNILSAVSLYPLDKEIVLFYIKHKTKLKSNLYVFSDAEGTHLNIKIHTRHIVLSFMKKRYWSCYDFEGD